MNSKKQKMERVWHRQYESASLTLPKRFIEPEIILTFFMFPPNPNPELNFSSKKIQTNDV